MDENRNIYFVKSDQKMFALLLSHESWNITGKPRSLDLARKQKEAREGGGEPTTWKTQDALQQRGWTVQD